MNEEVKKERDEKEFVQKTEELRKMDDEKTNKNRKRRMKRKEKKGKGGKEGDVEMEDEAKEQNENANGNLNGNGNGNGSSKANPNAPRGGEKKVQEREPSPQVEHKEGNGLIIHDDSD